MRSNFSQIVYFIQTILPCLNITAPEFWQYLKIKKRHTTFENEISIRLFYMKKKTIGSNEREISLKAIGKKLLKTCVVFKDQIKIK